MREIERIVNVFISPKRVFIDLKERPRWTVPFVILLITVGLIGMSPFTINKDNTIIQQKRILKEKGMSEEEIEQAISIMNSPFPLIVGFLGGCISISAILLIFAATLHFLIILFGGYSSFHHAFSVICYSSLVQVVAILMKLIFIGVTKSLNFITSFALLLPFMEKENFIYKVLSHLDLFTLWEMFLVGIGINITHRLKKSSSFVIVFIIWFIWIIIQLL